MKILFVVEKFIYSKRQKIMAFAGKLKNDLFYFLLIYTDGFIWHRKHMNIEFYYKITDSRLDPITLFDENGLVHIIKLAGLVLPVVENEENKRDAYLKVIYTYLGF